MDVAQAIDPQLLDLTSQQRNLLLMRPIFQLEITKAKFHDGNRESPALFEGIDTQYLCLAALNHMMEGTAVALGYTMAEVQEYLSGMALRMKPSLNMAQAKRIAGVVTDALDNAADNYQEHSYEYFHAPTATTRTTRFRLTSFEPDPEDNYRYRPTPQGYLLLIGMLDLEVEDHQILVERMLQLLIERGRFVQAYEFARRARVLSIEHRQKLRDFITQTWRAPGSVLWAKDIAPKLLEAREHIRGRQEEDRRMEESVRTQLLQVDDVGTREQLVRLHEVLKSAGNVRAHLQVDVAGAGDKFMNAQADAFRPRKPSGLPDLEAKLLPSALERPTSYLSETIDEVLLSFYPAVAPKTPDTSDFLALLLASRAMDDYGDEDTEEGDVVPFRKYEDPFSADVSKRVTGWLHTKFRTNDQWSIDQLLAAAEDEGFSKIERQFAVYALYRSFADSESLFSDMRAKAKGAFVSDVARGDDLQFERWGRP